MAAINIFLTAALALQVVSVTAQTPKIGVTGAPTSQASSAPPARININDLYQTGGPAWDLYVQALSELQLVQESDPLSYFSLMGIHGLPFQPYDGVGQVQGGADRAGFCPHNQILFGTWHRPYLALYEQTLVSHAVNISKRYGASNGQTYQAAAQNLRLAYWDWAAVPTLPAVVELQNVTVNGPTGRVSLRNPFKAYYFHNFPFQIEYMNAGVLSTQWHTTRCPTSGLADSVSTVNQNLASAGNLKAQVYEVFTTAEAFQDMDTDAYSQPSFESPHNNVHDSTGCANGTMYDLNWSAFDPLFMLHHANVDRLIAMWQAIYPSRAIFTITAAAPALYGSAAGNVNADSPLKPFYQANGNFHTSNSVRNVSSLGYTYPELVPNAGGAGVSAEALSTYVKGRVNALYSGTSSSSSTKKKMMKRSRRGEREAVANTTSSSTSSTKTWSVAIQLDKAQVALPATVKCYLGSELVGKMPLLAIPAEGITHATLPLDTALSGGGGGGGGAYQLNVANVEAVMQYVGESLRFEVTKTDGSTIALSSIPSLQIGVVDRDITPRKSDNDFPTYGNSTTHPWTSA